MGETRANREAKRVRPPRLPLLAATLAVVATMMVSTAANADTLAAGRAAYARRDYGRAAVQIVPLAERGNAEAQMMLGFMHATGQGVPQSNDLAAFWYCQAAERGNTTAQHLLGLLYDKGHGVPLDEVQAYKWLNLATAHAPKANRDYYQRLRDAVASKMTRGQIAAGQWLAMEWISRPRR